MASMANIKIDVSGLQKIIDRVRVTCYNHNCKHHSTDTFGCGFKRIIIGADRRCYGNDMHSAPFPGEANKEHEGIPEDFKEWFNSCGCDDPLVAAWRAWCVGDLSERVDK